MDDVDHDLLAFMREAMGFTKTVKKGPRETGVLESAQYIFDNSIDVALDRDSVVQAAKSIYDSIKRKSYSTQTWSEHELHPKAKDENTLNFIFTMDVLNFSFWSEKSEDTRFSVVYNGKKYTGYWSLIALINRALDEGIPITCPFFVSDPDICPDSLLEHVFRSDSEEQIPLLHDRITCLRQSGMILCERYDGSFANCVREAGQSASELIMRVADDFPCFRDEFKFEGRNVNFYKRAQILIADIWACFNSTSYGSFHDISSVTMFADYRVPVILNTMGCIMYAPKLEGHIRAHKPIPSGHSWELQLRGTTIWCVELIRREIEKNHPGCGINAILIDFYLYDTAKEMEERGEDMIPTHRTRSIWY
ncbi:hypothetical protein B9Z19DRAFT_1195180 [Tuber borchii]|uniref:Queuosine 5'-phosphate N-glycosylase/hydrolase n=1 Tax=Tuber borchii TaxID=42251 RepID=A0A2T6ZK23_TUBBO|nr:hypothetical protein B9Z19DRAFT_1195180 [Tuber borchii]